MKIYTRTGDKGQTALFGGKRVSKDNLRVEAYGTVDELNCVIGVVIAQAQKSNLKSQNYILKLKTELLRIQNDLFEIGAILATPSTRRSTLNAIRLKKRVEEFEKMIDQFTKRLPELRNFILPGGGKIGSILHFARTICRRVERRAVALAKKEQIDNQILIYLNRLSDLLFTMARFVNYKEKRKEIVWIKHET